MKFKAIKDGEIFHPSVENGDTHIVFEEGKDVEVPQKWQDYAIRNGFIAKPSNTNKKKKELTNGSD